MPTDTLLEENQPNIKQCVSLYIHLEPLSYLTPSVVVASTRGLHFPDPLFCRKIFWVTSELMK